MTVELSGFVFDNSGVAVNGAAISIFPRNTTSCATTTTTTNSSGFWTRSAIADARYDVEISSGGAISRIKYDDEIQVCRVEVANFLIRNPADTFNYNIVPGAITADRTLTLPLITGTVTLIATDTGIADCASIDFGLGGDSAIYYDGTDSFWDLRQVGTGDLMIALAGSFPSPDPGQVHIWKGTAGAVTACSQSILTVEGSDTTDNYISILGPNSSAKGILFGEPASPTRGFVRYIGSTDSPSDVLEFGTAGAVQYLMNATDFTAIDCNGVALGTGIDSRIFYNGSDTIWNLQAVGSGHLVIQNGNIKAGPSNVDRGTTEGTNQFVMFNGTVPCGTLANGASIYTKDVSCSAELHVMDEAGNETLLSPHDNGEWVFDSRNTVTGKGIHVRMEEMMKRLCDEFGWGLVTEYPATEC